LRVSVEAGAAPPAEGPAPALVAHGTPARTEPRSSPPPHRRRRRRRRRRRCSSTDQTSARLARRPIDAPCTQCLRHGDPIHAMKGLTAARLARRGSCPPAPAAALSSRARTASSARPSHPRGGGGGASARCHAASSTKPRRRAASPKLPSKRLLIESRWVSKPLALAGELRPRRLNK
jgi:hypothetical protein